MSHFIIYGDTDVRHVEVWFPVQRRHDLFLKLPVGVHVGSSAQLPPFGNQRRHFRIGVIQMHSADATISDWAQLVRAEYAEMPGLTLTEVQIQRLWSLDVSLCNAVIASLVSSRFLKQ